MKYLAIAVGGALGALSRYTLTAWWNTAQYPGGTLAANLSGCFLIGLLWGIGLENWSKGWQLFLITGVLGGYTTFSSFSLETLVMIKEHKILTGILYISVSVIGGLTASALGFLAGQYLPYGLFNKRSM